MTSNANYLHNPNRASTRVHQSPGGNSSLSLGWGYENQNKSNLIENPNEKSRRSTIQDVYSLNQKHIPASYPYSESTFQLKQQPESSPKITKFYQPNQGYLSLNDSTKMLEDQLHYYQQKNKFLRENIFGGYQNANLVDELKSYQPNYSSNMYSKKNIFQEQIRNDQYQQPEELERAVYKQNNWKPNKQLVKERNYSEKTSIRVHNPPGGKSSIVFG